MSNLYRGHAIDASYQVSVHLAEQFQRRRFLKIGQSETRIAYGGHVCQWIETKLAIFIKDFLRMLPTKFDSFGQAVTEEKILNKSTNQKQELSVAAMFDNGSGRNEQSL
jgi:hypothetical protein